MDIIGKKHPPSDRGHYFILAVTDYFSKWVETVPLTEVKADTKINFVKYNIISRFVVPKCLYQDNGPQFSNERFYRFYDKYGIQCCPSTTYNLAANGLAEAFNKTICKILKKMVSDNKRSWGTKLPKALWAYQTTVAFPTKSTPCSLVYECKAVVPFEIQLSSLRVVVAEKLTEEKNAKLRLRDLENLDEKRVAARQSIEVYQACIAGSFDKKVWERAFKKRDLVLSIQRPMILTHKSKGMFELK